MGGQPGPVMVLLMRCIQVFTQAGAAVGRHDETDGNSPGLWIQEKFSRLWGRQGGREDIKILT